MAKLFVTKKGSEIKSNSWKEGQEITCDDKLAKYFVEKGICSETPVKGKTEK